MLTSASFQNFKNLRDLTVDLGALTVLVGPNGCGKTSVLQGIHLMTQLGLRRSGELNHVNSRPGLLFSGRWHPRRLVSWGTRSLRMALSEADRGTGASTEVVSLACTLPADDDEVRNPQFVLDVPGQDPGRLELNGNGVLSNPLNVLNSSRLRRLSKAVFLHLDAALMSRPSVTEEAEPRLEQNGQGLPSVLSYISGSFPDQKKAIEESARAVVPRFRGFRTKPYKVARLVRRPFPVGHQAVDVPVEEEVWGHALSIEMEDSAIVPADMVSEGTILALGLVTLLHDPSAPKLILLDDLDRALHLGAQVRLIRTIRAIQKSRPDLQIVASTHSPYLLQEVSASDVRVLSAGPDGYARCRSLDQHPDYPRLRTLMDTGDLWASLGEDWVGNGG